MQMRFIVLQRSPDESFASTFSEVLAVHSIILWPNYSCAFYNAALLITRLAEPERWWIKIEEARRIQILEFGKE